MESSTELLTLVWNNLFSNTMKFTKVGGTVSLTLKSDSDFAVVQVSDTDCGISPKTGKHILEKIYQGNTSHATQKNELRLPLVKHMVDILNVDISVRNEIGKGSAFSVKIRRTNDDEIPATP